jgi:hypothetical protein
MSDKIDVEKEAKSVASLLDEGNKSDAEKALIHDFLRMSPHEFKNLVKAVSAVDQKGKGVDLEIAENDSLSQVWLGAGKEKTLIATGVESRNQDVSITYKPVVENDGLRLKQEVIYHDKGTTHIDWNFNKDRAELHKDVIRFAARDTFSKYSAQYAHENQRQVSAELSSLIADYKSKLGLREFHVTEVNISPKK